MIIAQALTCGETICRVDTCAWDDCRRGAGCQGHAWRERAPVHYEDVLEQLVRNAAHDGCVLTIEQIPRTPLAMGNYDSVVSVRRSARAEK